MWKSIIIIICLIGYSAAGSLASRHHVRFKAREDRSNEQIANADDVKPTAEIATDTTSADDAPSSRRTSKLNLPSNATSIRADIKDNFSCENRIYGYYADIENDCQIFHVCMPVTYADGKEHYFRWSFICPEDTIFSQDSFTCMHRQNMIIDCSESVQYYELNRNLGLYTTEETNKPTIKNNINNKNQQNNSDQEVDMTNQEDIVTAEKLQIKANVEEVITHKPIEIKPTPIKSYKPSRRKPIKTIVRPTEAIVVTTNDANINIKTEPAVVKKTIQKTYKRPSSGSTLKKNKPQIANQNVVSPTKGDGSKLNLNVRKPDDQINQRKDTLQQISHPDNEAPVTQFPEIMKINDPIVENEAEQVQNPTINTLVSDAEITENLAEKPLDQEASGSEVSNSPEIVNKETSTVDKTESIASDKESIQSGTEFETNVNVDKSDNVSNVNSTPMSDEDKNFLKQTAGGFEAVDSTMAAEAEALINDFLQTMLKSESPNIESTEGPISDVPMEEEQKVDSPINEIHETPLAAQTIPLPSQDEMSETPVDSASDVQSVPIEESENLKIPVTVVQTPLEETKETLETKLDVDPTKEEGHFSPISIDDVVASVKEHLDQTDTSDSEVVVEENVNETKQEEQQSMPESPENSIIPIYHRFPDSSSIAQLSNFETPQTDKATFAQLSQTDVGSETESQSTTS